MIRALKWLSWIAILLVAAAVGTIWFAFGGGKPYPDLSGAPQLPDGTIEPAVVFDRPIGNASVAADGRIYFTIHPESKPDYPKLYRWAGGKAEPFPAEDVQRKLLDTPLGVAIDSRNRLWVIDPGEHGTRQPRLVAFDLTTGSVAHQFDFPSSIAPFGSFVQDLKIDPQGRRIYIADVGFWAKRPALIVYDTETRSARRVLSRHASVYPQNWLIRNQIRDMSYFGGILQMKTGIDGIAVSRDGAWIYYGAMNHDTLYRIATDAVNDPSLDDAALAARIESVGRKPLNDGFAIDSGNNVFITDVEHQAVMRLDPKGNLSTVVKDRRIRWADGLSFGPDGWLYLADSAIPRLVLQSQDEIKKHAPFTIWRFKPGTAAAPGQ